MNESDDAVWQSFCVFLEKNIRRLYRGFIVAFKGISTNLKTARIPLLFFIFMQRKQLETTFPRAPLCVYNDRLQPKRAHSTRAAGPHHLRELVSDSYSSPRATYLQQ